MGLPSAPNRRGFTSKCVFWLGSCNTYLRWALLIFPCMLHRHSIKQHTILFGFSYLTRNKKSHNYVRIWRQEHAWCSHSSAVSSTLHWLLVTFRCQGSKATVSLADWLTVCSKMRSHDIGLSTSPRAQQMAETRSFINFYSTISTMYASLLRLSVTHNHYCEIPSGAHPHYMFRYTRTNLNWNILALIRNCSNTSFKVGFPFVLISLMVT